MLEVLLESRHVKPPPPVVGAGVSAFAHVAIVVALALASRQIVDDWRETTQEVLQYLLPPDRLPQPEQHSIKYVARGEGESPYGGAAGSLEFQENAAAGLARRAGERQARESEISVATTIEDLPENTYSVLDVDTAVFRYEDSAAPAYPASMIARNVSGYAKMQFIVDSTGVIDLSSVKTLGASHPEFVAAVRLAMPRMRFHPAKIGPRAVGQLAEQQFVFALKPAEQAVAKKP